MFKLRHDNLFFPSIQIRSRNILRNKLLKVNSHWLSLYLRLSYITEFLFRCTFSKGGAHG